LPVDDFEPIEQGSRYVFGETDSFYGVWDKQAGTELVEQYPLTDEGFEQASARFDELKGKNRVERGTLLYALLIVMVLGAISMVLGAVLETIVADFFEVDFLLGSRFAYALSLIGYNLTIGGLALLVGLTLIRRETRLRAASVAASTEPPSGPTTGSSVMWGVLLVALGVWIASSITTQLLFRMDFGSGEVPGTAERVAATVESLAFRVWVGALAIWWGRRLLLLGTGDARQAAQ
jgi:hypothetical protein